MKASISVGLVFLSLLMIQMGAYADGPQCPSGQHWDPSMNMCMPDAVPIQPTYTWFRSGIISQRCAMCHTTTEGDGDGLDKANFDTYEGVLAVLKPGDPLNSTLYNVLLKKKMPKLMDGQTTAPYLNDAELNALSEWITQGAKQN